MILGAGRQGLGGAGRPSAAFPLRCPAMSGTGAGAPGVWPPFSEETRDIG